ncbi:MAG: sugar phosphate isomerase/epimerase [Nitrospirae bacterium]|nr:sugar phosphate isomerase/epimerase [Nitrospirota bacterium]
MIKLSFSTNAFVRYSVFKAIEKIADIGYEGVELVTDIPHLYVYSITDSDMRKLKETIARTRIQVANVNANTAKGYYGRTFWDPLFEPSIANPDPTVRKWRIDYSKKCIDLAFSIGCSNISLTSGRMIPGVDLRQSLDILQESLRELLDYASEKNIRIAIEPEPGLLIEYSRELESLLEEVDSPLLGVNLDLGHSHVLGEAPETVVETFSGKIFHVHIEDIRARKHYHLIPGLGDMDFEMLFGLLDKYSYDGFVTVELYTYPYQPDEAARKSFSFLKGLSFWSSVKV